MPSPQQPYHQNILALPRVQPILSIGVIALTLLSGGCQTLPQPSESPLEIAPPAQNLAVTLTVPKNGAQTAATNGAVFVQFNQPLKEELFKFVHLQLEGVEGRVTRGRQALVFWPKTPLRPNTQYHATLAVRTSIDGTPTLTSNWRFRTGSESIKLLAHKVPAKSGEEQLFRYPYVQSHHPRAAAILWATTSAGSATIEIRSRDQDIWLTLPARTEVYDVSVTGMTHPYHQHEANIDGLEPATEYYYQLRHDRRYLATGIPFRTLPEQTSDTVRFVAFGDSGTKYSQPRAVRDAIVSRTSDGSARFPHDFVVGLGDIAYHNGTFTEFNNHFFDQLSGKGDRLRGENSLLASRSFVAVLGNHEYANNEKTAPKGFLNSFVNPRAAGVTVEDAERYYSFDSGDAHFVILDSMKFQRRDTRGQREMLAWLENDLSRTNRKWRIAFLHHAIFAHGPHGTYGDMVQNQLMRQRLSPILQRHGVQLVIFGHDHLYERSKRLTVDDDGQIVRDSNCQIIESSKGIVYVTVGIGGADLHSRKVEPEPCGSDGYDRAWREYGDGYDFVALREGVPILYDSTDKAPRLPSLRHGFLHAIVQSERLSVTTYNFHGEVLDHFELKQ